ncbi:MAG: hypothetical protein ACI9K3_001173 [Halovenus sp.]|jgi:hypothetical protein
MLLAFATVGVIEFRTVLSMFGVEVATGVYYPVAALVVALVVAALLLLPERDSGDDGGPEGNPSEA